MQDVELYLLCLRILSSSYHPQHGKWLTSVHKGLRSRGGLSSAFTDEEVLQITPDFSKFMVCPHG